MKQTISNVILPWRPASRLTAVIRFAVAFLLTMVLQSIFGPVVAAQEFRIYTQIFQDAVEPGAAADAPGQSNLVARTLTVFHAGKVYDYIESVGEVIIFEPAHERFTILSTSRRMSTQVTLEELTEMLDDAGQAVQNYIDQPLAEGGPLPRTAESLKFQLTPRFDVKQNADDNTLKLISPFVRYEARCAAAQSAAHLESYLRYADWTCRLNYVLHPRTLYPASRLQLNEVLRAKQLLPTEVRLVVMGETPVALKARHQIHWKLDSKDRSLINLWENQLKDGHTDQVEFRDYQKAMLISLSRRTR